VKQFLKKSTQTQGKSGEKLAESTSKEIGKKLVQSSPIRQETNDEKLTPLDSQIKANKTEVKPDENEPQEQNPPKQMRGTSVSSEPR
jgi:hypothetical protein